MALEERGGWAAVLSSLLASEDLSADVTHDVLAEILAGEATDAQIAAFIVALRQKGETVDELTGLVDAMLEAAEPLSLPEGTIDIVGAGGAPSRQQHALNVSTLAAFVAAGAGATVCKHGNRKASSTSGSFDLLEALGIDIDLTPRRLEQCVAETGLGFAFARTFHPAMRHVGPVRAELGVKTVFNVLGPLSHPGRLTHQVIGVSEEGLADRMIRVLEATGSVNAMVVTGHDRLDEITTTGPTSIRHLIDGEVVSSTMEPADVGLESVSADELAGGDAADNAAIAREVFAGEDVAARGIIAVNAAAGLVVAGIDAQMSDAVVHALDAIDSGAAAAKLDELRSFAPAS